MIDDERKVDYRKVAFELEISRGWIWSATLTKIVTAYNS
jgi:hypothetical protein